MSKKKKSSVATCTLFLRQVLFPMAGSWDKLKKNIRAELNEDQLK